MVIHCSYQTALVISRVIYGEIPSGRGSTTEVNGAKREI